MDLRGQRESTNVEDRRSMTPPDPPAPKWLDWLMAKQNAARHGSPYETGDGTFDEYLKTVALGGMGPKHPTQIVYENSDEARFTLQKAYQMGQHDAYGAFQQMMGKYQDTPFGHVAWRAYNDGLNSDVGMMNARQRRSGGMQRFGGLGFAESGDDQQEMQ